MQKISRIHREKEKSNKNRKMKNFHREMKKIPIRQKWIERILIIIEYFAKLQEKWQIFLENKQHSNKIV